MPNTFSTNHPWLSRKVNIQRWNLLKKMGINSFSFTLNNTKIIFKVNPKDDSVSENIFLDCYEKETVFFASKFIKEGDRVMDIGANIGYFTLLFSSYVKDSGEVHSFEPSQREFLHLCENVKLNRKKNIFLNQIALSDENAYAKMNVLDEDRFGAYNSINDITHRNVKLAHTHTETIRTLKIDTYLELFTNFKPSLIKVDVEGYEKQVLKGMQTLLLNPNAPCLIIEVCEYTHQDNQNGAQDLLDFLRKFDYQLYSPNQEGNLVPFELGKSLNCIAIKQTHFKRLEDQGIIFATAI